MTVVATQTHSKKSLGSPKATSKKSSDESRQRLDRSLVQKAVDALLKHHKEQTAKSKVVPLLGTDVPVQVQFTLEIAPEQIQHKPFSVLLPHPIHKLSGDDDDNADVDEDGLEEPQVCLIVKEDAKPWVQEVIAQFPEHMGCVKKVLGLQSLRTKHATFQQRRELMHKYTVFLADDRILPMLTKALGSTFLRAKKQPVPVKLHTSNKTGLPVAIHKALSGTHMFVSNGTCWTVRAGNTGMPSKKVVDNILAVCGSYNKGGLEHSLGAVRKIPRQWANVRAIAVKTSSSMALPVYNKTPAELMEIAKLAGLDPVWNKVEKKKKEKKDQPDDAKALQREEEKERKRKLSAKSPLVRALKKQKQQEKEEANNSVSAEEDSKKEDKKKSKRKKISQSMSAKNDAKPEKTTEEPKTSASKKAKKIKEANLTESNSPSKQEEFIVAKKFKGSKEGYIFQKGKKGLGYYQDVKPIVDKMALEAVCQKAQQKKGRRGGSKSPSGHRNSGGGKNRHRR